MSPLIFTLLLTLTAAPPDSAPLTKAQIVATVPAKDSDGTDRPLELISAISAGGINGSEFFITLHRGESDLVRVYTREDSGYRLLLTRRPEMDQFDTPVVFHYGGNTDAAGAYLHIADLAHGTGHFREDFVYRLADGRLDPVEWAEPPNAYRALVRKDLGEGIWKGANIRLTDGGLAFCEFIWNRKDGNCCPTAGRIDGTYRIDRVPASDPQVPDRYVIRMESFTRTPIESEW